MLWQKPRGGAGNRCAKKNSPPFDANSPLRFGNWIIDTSFRCQGSPSHLCGGIGRVLAQRGNRKVDMGPGALQRTKRRHAPDRSAFMAQLLPRLLARLACAGWLAVAILLTILMAIAVAPGSVQAQNTNLQFGEQRGGVSGLPLPRFVSLKADRVNLHEGPSRDHRTTWVFQRAGLPVEVTAEFDVWRRVRDSEGTEGWVLHSLLSGRRTALVAPWKKGDVFTLLAQPAKNAAPIARLQSGVIAGIKTCDGSWCHISGDGFDGYIAQTSLWGVYPNEKIE